MIVRRVVLMVSLAIAALMPAFAANPTLQSSPSSQRETRSAPERLAAYTPRVTPGGATFTVPTGWSNTAGKSLGALEPPELDTDIAVIGRPAASAPRPGAHARAPQKRRTN